MKKITLLFVILFTAVMANAITKQYAATDIATLQADIASGAADIYELTTPGGNYQFLFTSASSSSVVISKTMTIRAAANLYVKPIISISNPTTGTTSGIFTTATAGITVTLQGLEFNGINPAVGGTQLLLFSSTAANDNLYINNCYIHNFLNGSGNGIIYFNTVSTAQTIDIQNSTFNNCGGRMIQMYPGSGTLATNYNLKNNTFSNCPLVYSRGNLIYNRYSNSGTTTIDHCTFYNLSIDSGTLIKQTSTGNGTVTVNNCIFVSATAYALATNVPAAANLNNNYLAGLTGSLTGTNPQNTLPVFLNPLILDFTLTNKASFTASDASQGIGNMGYYPTLSALTAPSQPNAASSIGYVNFTAGWTPVSGASGYTIYVYNSLGTALITSATVSGQATSSVVIGGLAGNTSYYYTVKALSDGTVASNSFESPISATFTTLIPIVLTAPTVGTASAIGGTGFVANWTPSANATNYTINVYNSVPALVKSVTTTTGQATASTPVTGLTASTAYTYTIIALGNGGQYSSSVESVASSFSTVVLVATVPTIGSASAIASESFVANWTSVANVTSYTIKVYDATPTLKATVTTPAQFGANVSNACITGGATPLALNTTYTYTVTANGDGIYTTTSTESPKSASFTTLSTYPAAINTNFGDGTWGTAVATTTAGTFPSNSYNGFDLAAATLYANTFKGNKGEVHTNCITLDKTTNGGTLILPTVNSIQELEIHSSMGTAEKTFTVMESVLSAGVWSAWTAVGTTYNYSTASKSAGLDSIFVITVVSSSPTKLKIINGSTGSMYIQQVITRTTTSLPSINRPSGTLTTILSTNSTGFTATWPNTVAANVSGYKVNVYSSKLKTLVTSATVSDPAALSLNITGLQADSTYTYGVVALSSNNSQYLDSYMWSAIASGATSALTVTTNLAAPVVGATTGISSSGFTTNWAQVNNASSYDVKVYDATTTQVGTTANVAAGTLSLAVIGLNPNANYTYTVTAKGDGTSHFDSAPSAPVAVTTTIGTGLNNLNGSSFITASGKTIISSETGLFQVYNVQGAKVLEVLNANKINTTLDSGLYIVRFTGKDGQLNSAKVLIK